MNPPQFYRLGVVVCALASVCPALTQTDVEHAAGDVPAHRGSDVRLAPLAGFADDKAFLESVASRVAELQQRGGETDDAQRNAAFLLAAANLILAEQLEPACSRKLLRVGDPPEGDVTVAPRTALDRADALIAEAETMLKGIEERNATGEDAPAADRTKALAHVVETLRAFSQALRTYLTPEADADLSRVARRAASGLSVILEDDDPQIASTAAFWQACLRAMETDPAPALAVLDPTVVDPPAESLRFGFFSRLLRCRLVAARGGPAAALALLMQVEERANDWFKTDSDRAEALRTCTWVRVRILQDWHDRLDPMSASEERTWCRSQMDTLRADRFPDSRTATVLRLGQAIPIVARPPSPDPTNPEGNAAP